MKSVVRLQIPDRRHRTQQQHPIWQGASTKSMGVGLETSIAGFTFTKTGSLPPRGICPQFSAYSPPISSQFGFSTWSRCSPTDAMHARAVLRAYFPYHLTSTLSSGFGQGHTSTRLSFYIQHLVAVTSHVSSVLVWTTSSCHIPYHFQHSIKAQSCPCSIILCGTTRRFPIPMSTHPCLYHVLFPSVLGRRTSNINIICNAASSGHWAAR